MHSKYSLLASLALLLLATVSARADVFNMPGGQKSLEFVIVGDAGNAADITGHGAVNYAYGIGKFDVTTAQYCEFLNAVAKTDTYTLYIPDMGMPGEAIGCGIVRSGMSGNYTYNVLPDSGTPGQAGYANYANYPVNFVTWGDAARFCNWLQNAQPTGPQGPSTTETGAYTLNGATTISALMTVNRNPSARYAIPTEDEWYKAAYYKGGGANAGYWLYPTQSDTAPVNILSSTGTNNANFYDFFHTGNGGATDPLNFLTAVGTFMDSPGPYGAYDMGGDVLQWNEIAVDGSHRGLWGGGFYGNSDHLRSSDRTHNYPVTGGPATGFRVVMVPEPNSIILLLAGVSLMATWRLRRGRSS